MKRLQHPNLLPLLGSALVSVDTASGARAQACTPLMPYHNCFCCNISRLAA